VTITTGDRHAITPGLAWCHSRHTKLQPHLVRAVIQAFDQLRVDGPPRLIPQLLPAAPQQLAYHIHRRVAHIRIPVLVAALHQQRQQLAGVDQVKEVTRRHQAPAQQGGDRGDGIEAHGSSRLAGHWWGARGNKAGGGGL
jgi:hypothetical protein